MPHYFFDLFDATELAVAITTAVSIFSLIYAVVIPSLGSGELEKRMKSVAVEREILRKQQITSLQKDSASSRLRTRDSKSLRNFVKKLNLKAILVDENIVNKLRAAGFRSEYSLNILLVVRLVVPIIFLILGIIWIFGYDKLLEYPFQLRVGAVILIGYVGFCAPSVWISNLVQKRQSSIKRAWPDALDLLLICVESGISIDQALRRVAEDIGGQSVPLSEEMLLTIAELSFLPNRQVAFENFYNRTQMDCVRNATQALIQSDRYGTSIGDSLRVLVSETRSERLMEAEKKAASLGPKLTVPMIIFFLPVLILVIIGPAILSIIDTMKDH
ncbi:type II secretion system F family protein [Candidatus Liberibacter asiaticus]|uniref:Pilus component protein n=2 Tax=Liberibacter asiaticus TaxID=34021 RepID=C6XFP1_LIBAP|nr:type II secretion system F family protein [Candidatus Liberibacter asiaticus]ACT57194.1 pilus component protein [Candidatus Liberibacter asiaticus str. psy62]AGH16843.1 pilus component protein [Candidatus Liberibacter asiaticus str. gxpsy]ALK07201.1 type II secretion system F family protein [Candidatus Liberibacter asiaticus]ASK52682.1 type II secretion system protein [Candidatus Liberibacter asiaticus]AWL14007.1 type II secretion system F family protein [Candidatus Liberibacter asiaticus]